MNGRAHMSSNQAIWSFDGKRAMMNDNVEINTITGETYLWKIKSDSAWHSNRSVVWAYFLSSFHFGKCGKILACAVDAMSWTHLSPCLPLSWHMSCAYSAKQIRYETVTKANWTEMSCIVHIKHIANITNITTSLFKHSINLCERFIFHFSCMFLWVTFSLSLSHPCESHLHLTIKRA